MYMKILQDFLKPFVSTPMNKYMQDSPLTLENVFHMNNNKVWF